MPFPKELVAKDKLAKTFEKCSRKAEKEMFVAFVDANKMKQANDTFGHIAGDYAIEEIAEVLVASVREGDKVIRFGGDEFLLILVGFDKAGVKKLVKRIQKGVQKNKILRILGVDLSIGVTKYDPEKHQDLEAVIHEADKLMYKAKKLTDHKAFEWDKKAA